MPLKSPPFGNVCSLANNLLRCRNPLNCMQARHTCKTTKPSPPDETPKQRPCHLICFRSWTSRMVMDILLSALNLKCCIGDTHNKRLETILPNTKVMILQDKNEPILNMAVSKAATLLGASDVTIKGDINWEYDYNGRIYSAMADIIFVTTRKHMCIQKFANCSTVPVLCMRSRTNATIQALATIMSIMEDYGTLKGLNLSYVGRPHPVLNSYLILAPMLGANLSFKCSCKKCPVSPLLLDAGLDLCSKASTVSKQFVDKGRALNNCTVVIAGPTSKNKDKNVEFALSYAEIAQYTCFPWTFYHTCPRGDECDEGLFWSSNARTFNAFQNMIYIAAALMASSVKNCKF